MGILLNGSKPSKIIYNGAESSLYFNGYKIWPEEAIYELWVNDNTQYTSTTDIPLTGMPAQSDLNYVTFIFDAKYSPSSGVADYMFLTSSYGIIWRSRYYSGRGLGFVGITGNVTGWTSASGQATTAFTADGVTYIVTDKWLIDNWVNLKFVFDRIENKCYFYVNNELIGYAVMNADILTCDHLHIAKETSTYAYLKNLKVAAFANLNDAQVWNG